MKNKERGSALTETILLLPLLLVLWLGLFEIHKIADFGEKMYAGIRHAALILSKHDYRTSDPPQGGEWELGEGYTMEELSVFAGWTSQVVKEGKSALYCYVPLSREEVRLLRLASVKAEKNLNLFPFLQKFFPGHAQSIKLEKSVSFAFRKRGKLLYQGKYSPE